MPSENRPKKLPKRDRTGHKGTYGTVIGIGGSLGMAGSVALSGRAALLAGAGIVKLAVPDVILETVASFFPEIMTLPLRSDKAGRISRYALESIIPLKSSAVFIGPGLGRSAGLDWLVPKIIERFSSLHIPIVIDADALNAIASEQIMKFLSRLEKNSIILTPHPGEFARLRQMPIDSGQIDNGQNEQTVLEFARNCGQILILKGHETLISDGSEIVVNRGGNSGMATAGSGDVLTGLIAGFLTQGFDTFESAKLGVWLHSISGDIAAETLGEYSLTAADIAANLPIAIREWTLY